MAFITGSSKFMSLTNTMRAEKPCNHIKENATESSESHEKHMSNRSYYRSRVSSMLGAVFMFLFWLETILAPVKRIADSQKANVWKIRHFCFVLAVTPIVIYSQTTRKITCVCIPFPVGDIFVSSCVISFLLCFSLSFALFLPFRWCFTQFRILSCWTFFFCLGAHCCCCSASAEWTNF